MKRVLIIASLIMLVIAFPGVTSAVAAAPNSGVTLELWAYPESAKANENVTVQMLMGGYEQRYGFWLPAANKLISLEWSTDKIHWGHFSGIHMTDRNGQSYFVTHFSQSGTFWLRGHFSGDHEIQIAINSVPIYMVVS